MNQPQLQTYTNLLASLPATPIISGVGRILGAPGFLESAMAFYWISRIRIPLTEVTDAVKEIEDGITKRSAVKGLPERDVPEQ
jgi:hypothetical protein